MKRAQQKQYQRYFVFTESELLFLGVCILLDISEYLAAILLLPLFGDIFDLAGILGCFLMFQWIGLFSILELIPGLDILPIFIITWIIWYLTKKNKILTKTK